MQNIIARKRALFQNDTTPKKGDEIVKIFSEASQKCNLDPSVRNDWDGET